MKGSASNVELMPPPRGVVRPAGWRLALKRTGEVVFFAGIALVTIAGGNSGHPASPFLAIAGIGAAALIHTIVHEAGHVLAGLAIGRELLGASVGRWRLEPTRSGWRLRRDAAIRGVGGFARMLPRADEGRAATALFLLGGPLANLLSTGTLALALALRPPAASLWGTFAIQLVVVGLLIGVANLVPFSTRSGWSSDGKTLLALVRAAPTPAERAHASTMLRIVALSRAGTRPRDLPLETLDPPSAEAEVGVWMLRAMAALDRHDLSATRQALLPLLAAYPTLRDGFRQVVAVLAASHAAQLRDPVLLRAWRPECNGGVHDQSASIDWLDAELAFADGAVERSLALLTRARERCARIAEAGARIALSDAIDEASARMTPAIVGDHSSGAM